MSSPRKRIRQLLSSVPALYEAAAILRLIGLRLSRSEKSVISAIQLVKSNQGLALDVGANRGQSAIRIAQLKPGFKIVSFEPNPKCRFALEIVKFMLGDRFSFRLAGVSDNNGEGTYYEPFINSLPVSAEGTFFPENLDAEMEERLGKKYEIRKTVFPILRLDDLNLSPDFVKIDVQGWELNVLRGARETIVKSHPVLVIEKNNHNERETTEFLACLGYRKCDEQALHQNGLTYVDLSGDNVFVHQGPAAS